MIMRVQIEKFGKVLSSRQAGKDAYLGFLPVLNEVAQGETVEVDFSGIESFSPSWGDEFLTPLLEKFGDRLVLVNTDNLSVALTIETLEETSGKKFKVR